MLLQLLEREMLDEDCGPTTYVAWRIALLHSILPPTTRKNLRVFGTCLAVAVQSLVAFVLGNDLSTASGSALDTAHCNNARCLSSDKDRRLPCGVAM